MVRTALFAAALLAGCGEADPAGGGTGGAGGGGGGTGVGGSTPVGWEPLPEEGAPSPRYLHSAVWTGSKMIVWGGRIGGAPPVTATGGVYDPATRSWQPMSLVDAPEARHSHRAAWTGSRMIIWGGYGVSSLASAGAAYDPEADTWSPIATAGQPEGRLLHSAVWTGSKLVVWGGLQETTTLGTGGIYDPASDAWQGVSAPGAPSPRHSHTAVWTGSQMIVWGGGDTFDWFANGAILDPEIAGGGNWVGATDASGAPSLRERHTGAWTEAGMLVWGGWDGGNYHDTGAVLGATGGWAAMTTAGAPAPRADHVGVWTGEELFVWGGCGGDACGEVYADGGRWTPGSGGGSWRPIEAEAGLSKRRGATAVLTGTSVLVWGGRVGSSELLGSGAAADL